MKVKLEVASINEMAEINMIQKLAFKASYDKYKFCPAFEMTDDQIVTYLEKAFVYKIIKNEKIVGSIFIYKIGDNHYELDTISIHPKYQDAGIGGEAIALIEKIYSDALVWSLSTPETDYRNRHFYEKIGYIQFDAEVINEHLTLIRYRKEVRLITT